VIQVVCYSLTKPNWYKSDALESSKKITRSTYTYVAHRASSSNNGKYKCKGTKHGGLEFSAAYKVFIAGISLVIS